MMVRGVKKLSLCDPCDLNSRRKEVIELFFHSYPLKLQTTPKRQPICPRELPVLHSYRYLSRQIHKNLKHALLKRQ